MLVLSLPIRSKPSPLHLFFSYCLSSSSSSPSIPVSTLLKCPPPTQSPTTSDHPNPPPHIPLCNPQDQDEDPLLLQNHSQTISKLLKQFPDNPTALQSALDNTGIQPNPPLIQTLILSSQFSPKPIHTLYLWASNKPHFNLTPSLFNSTVDLLAKARHFDSAWSLLIPHLHAQNLSSSPVSVDTFAVLIRRYARSGWPQAAIRTLDFMESLGLVNSSSNLNSNLDLLLDALCKEGHVNAAFSYFQQRKESEPNRLFSVRVYNILLNGFFRSRKLRKAERLYEEMRSENVDPTVVTFGTLVEGYCRTQRVDKAIELLSEMKQVGVEPNMIVYNPIIDALGEAERFKEALGMVEMISVHGLSPNISTFNSLVKGFCKAGDLVEASKVLKTMTGRGCMPTSTTYNYFFGFFAKFGKIEEAMNLYTKMINSGYDPDRLTYHLLIKMLCKCKRWDLALQVIKEMNTRGCDSDLATGTMLVHLLCRLRRLEEACTEFEGMIRRGLVPQYITYKMLIEEMKELGRLEMVGKLSALMGSVLHSTKLPNTYRDGEQRSLEARSAILRKAQVMSDALKICKNPRELSKQKGSSDNGVASANHLIADFQRKLFAT
ncbi:hypothetical protein AAC387_Pa03g3557 [Persea americana]